MQCGDWKRWLQTSIFHPVASPVFGTVSLTQPRWKNYSGVFVQVSWSCVCQSPGSVLLSALYCPSLGSEKNICLGRSAVCFSFNGSQGSTKVKRNTFLILREKKSPLRKILSSKDIIARGWFSNHKRGLLPSLQYKCKWHRSSSKSTSHDVTSRPLFLWEERPSEYYHWPFTYKPKHVEWKSLSMKLLFFPQFDIN